jgi:hypothetical protein
MGCQVCKEEFEDTKGVIRIRKSKKNRQHNEQKKKYKRTNNDLQNKHIKLNSGNTKPLTTGPRDSLFAYIYINILTTLINFYKQEIPSIGTLFQPCDILFTKATSHTLVSLFNHLIQKRVHMDGLSGLQRRVRRFQRGNQNT